ncbi:reverse transcriptase domain-containing protein [Tanacetum coccineum]|uniref:Reverse transcriptase domain-containing protein n=1 Tax=Tanacetum coccineum TaxID=301880 RepID=A0ABQ5AMD7_9ASTR
MIRMREDIPEEDQPPRRRFVLTAPPPGCDVAESSAAAAARAPRGQYDFVDAVEAGQGLTRSPGHDAQTIARAADRAKDVGYVRALQASKRRMMTSMEEVNLRVSYQAQVRRQESEIFYTQLHDARTDRRDIRLEIDVVRAPESWDDEIMPVTRQGTNDAMTPESIQAMIDRAIQRNSTQDDDSQNLGGGIRRPVQPARMIVPMEDRASERDRRSLFIRFQGGWCTARTRVRRPRASIALGLLGSEHMLTSVSLVFVGCDWSLSIALGGGIDLLESGFKERHYKVWGQLSVTYPDFMKCQPLNFKGTEGVVGLNQWLEKMESVFHISGCAVENQVKFATCTLLGAALTWWNGHVRTLGHDAAYAMTWGTFKKKLSDKYCPNGEIKKLEIELWNLKVKGNDVAAYTQRFQELALMCTKFLADETAKIDKYIGGLPDNIHGNVMSARPKTLDFAIELANDLMDQKLRTYAERQNENKRKADDSSRNNHQQQSHKRQM